MAEPAGSGSDILKELQNASADQLEQIIKKLHVKIGVFGGRRFYLEGGPTVSMQEIIDTLKTRSKSADPKEGSVHHHVWAALKEKQVAGEQQLNKANIFKRILSVVRRLSHTVDRSTLIDAEISDSATRSFQKRLAALPGWTEIKDKFYKGQTCYADIKKWDEDWIKEQGVDSEKEYLEALEKRNQLREGIIAILKEVKPEELEFFLKAIIAGLSVDWKSGSDHTFYTLVMGCLPWGNEAFQRTTKGLMEKILAGERPASRAYTAVGESISRQSSEELEENDQLCKELIARGVIH